MQGKVEAATEDTPATGRPPCSPYRLGVHRVGLQAVPRVHSIPHLQGKQRQTAPDTVMKAFRKGFPRELGSIKIAARVFSSPQCTGSPFSGAKETSFPVSTQPSNLLLPADHRHVAVLPQPPTVCYLSWSGDSTQPGHSQGISL